MRYRARRREESQRKEASEEWQEPETVSAAGDAARRKSGDRAKWVAALKCFDRHVCAARKCVVQVALTRRFGRRACAFDVNAHMIRA